MWRSAFVAAGGLLLATGCGGPRYADDPDLTGTRAAFECEAKAGPRQKRACVGMDRFESASAVESYADEGLTAYLGRLDCVGHTDEIVFMAFGLAGGESPSNVDEAHKPPGTLRVGLTEIEHNELRRTAAYVTLEKLIDGEDKPFLTAPQIEDGKLYDSWDGWRSTVDEAAERTANSDGKSLLIGPGHTPAMWDGGEETPAFAYVREIDDEIIYVRPAGGNSPACVAHTYKMP